jgi:hypothetical protein
MSSGSATFETVAQVAADDPDTEPKMPHPRMFTCMRRPGMRFNHGARPSNISRDRRVRKRISPIQMNIGSAASVHELVLPQNALKRFLPGGVPVKNVKQARPTMASVSAIQTPPASSANMNASRIPAISMRLTCPRCSRRARAALP